MAWHGTWPPCHVKRLQCRSSPRPFEIPKIWNSLADAGHRLTLPGVLQTIQLDLVWDLSLSLYLYIYICIYVYRYMCVWGLLRRIVAIFWNLNPTDQSKTKESLGSHLSQNSSEFHFWSWCLWHAPVICKLLHPSLPIPSYKSRS